MHQSRRPCPSGESTWDVSASAYDRFERRWGYYARVARQLLRPLKIRRDSRVLELASGTGACTLLISRSCISGQVVCVERSMEMIKIARNNLMKEEGQDNITFIHGDVAQLSDLLRGVEKFDFAVCNSAFWQFSEPERVVASVRRLLKPGGIFAFNMPLWYTSGKKHLAFRRTVKRILRQHGIEATKFFRERKQKEYVRLLNKKGLFVIRDSLYGVDMGQKEREVWRRIPAFSRQWGYFKAIPPKVSAEIRREVRKMKLLPWPENKVLKSRWRLILAKTKV